MNHIVSRSHLRALSRIVLGTLGGLAVVGVVTTASAEVQKRSQDNVTMNQVEAKQNLPQEWRWQRAPINLDGMIRAR